MEQSWMGGDMRWESTSIFLFSQFHTYSYFMNFFVTKTSSSLLVLTEDISASHWVWPFIFGVRYFHSISHKCWLNCISFVNNFRWPGQNPWQRHWTIMPHHEEYCGIIICGPDICACHPYLTHMISSKLHSNIGVGIVNYYWEEGRSMGKVKKYLVYKNLKRQEGGYLAGNYVKCTKKGLGVQLDFRLSPLHILGVTKILNLCPH